MQTLKRQSTVESILLRACAIVSAACSLVSVCVPLFAADPSVAVSAESRKLSHKSSQVRAGAIRALGRAGSPQAAAALAAHLAGEKDPSLRSTAIVALGSVETTESVSALRSVAADAARPATERLDALEALARFRNNAAARAAVMGALDDPDPLVRRVAASFAWLAYPRSEILSVLQKVRAREKDPAVTKSLKDMLEYRPKD